MQRQTAMSVGRGGSLVASHDLPNEVTIYMRNGTKFAQHYQKECPNRWCRKTFYYDHTVKKGVKVYDTQMNRKYLVTSAVTAFSIDLCFEITLHILHNNATFHGLENVYNHLHNFGIENITRVNINRKRIATAFHLYGFLEFTSRQRIAHEFKLGDGWLDNTILEYYNVIKGNFSYRWAEDHACEMPDCERMMVSDGGMKIFRSVCAAKFSAVRKFKHSNKTVLTGCTASPNPNSPFCSEHLKTESPVVLAEQISLSTRMTLHECRAKYQKTNLVLQKDSVFIIQSVLNSRKNNKNNTEYLVKFAGFPDEAACWESSKNLPGFINKFYGKIENLGKALPKPSIKKTKHINNDSEIYLELEWGSTGDFQEYFEEEDLFDLDADRLCEEAMKSTCNTRKIRDKRDRRHTAGIAISARSCGIIPHVDELYGCESITQIHGSIIEFLGTTSEKSRNQLKLWMFDDMCHLKPHSEKEDTRKQSEICEQFARLAKCVDKFHFPGHKKNDVYCQENCNPRLVLKELNVLQLNSPACEQAFKWINAFKNLKTMNEARFKFFLLYVIDLHNLNTEGMVGSANPRNQSRTNPDDKIEDDILVNELEAMAIVGDSLKDDSHGRKDDFNRDMKDVSHGDKDDLVKPLPKVNKIEDCFTIDDKGVMSCNFCPGKYKREGHLKNHIETKHNIDVELICSCGQVFSETTPYNRHKKNCK